jgi:IS30 family transposase
MIAIGMKQGQSIRATARWVGCSASRVSRELRRNGGAEAYEAPAASFGYRERRRRCVRRRKLIKGSRLWQVVHDQQPFHHGSPEQIAATLRRMHPGDPAWSISHETIYAAIYAHPRGSLREGLIEVPAQRKPRRGLLRRTAAKSGLRVLEALRIAERPEAVTARKLPGHWEGDFLKGAYNRSASGTMVEGKTRFVVLCKLDGCDAASALEDPPGLRGGSVVIVRYAPRPPSTSPAARCVRTARIGRRRSRAPPAMRAGCAPTRT